MIVVPTSVGRRFTRFENVSLFLLLLVVAGCSRFDSDYGATEGSAGNESLNGFGAFRSALLESPAGAVPEMRSHDIASLSLREIDSDAIVWIPTNWSPMNLQEIQDWMDNWLSQDHRTLVLIVPDSGSTEAYFREAATLAPPAQRLAYRRKLAKLINERLLSENERQDIALGNWFTADVLPYPVELPSRQQTDFSIRGHGTRSRIPKKSKNDFDVEAMVQHTVTFPKGPKSLTTLAQINCPRWKSSQMIVVASGSLLTNFAMTGAAAQDMTDKIRDQIRHACMKDADRNVNVGFLSSGYGPVPVSDAKPGFPKARGWELMTEMPLSLINLHVAFLGVVLCLMLLPVFGRPRHVRYSQPTQFGNHLSAMATLMHRSGGAQYAKQKISEYLRQVRGETSGPWVLPQEDVAESEQQSQKLT